MQGISLAFRLIGIGLLTVVIASISGLIGGYGLISASRQFHAYEDMTNDALLITEVNADMAKALLHMDKFIETGNTGQLRLSRKYIAEAKEGSARALTEILSLDQVDLVKKIPSELAIIEKGVDQLEVILREQKQLANEILDKAGMDVRAGVSRIREISAAAVDYETSTMAGQVLESFLTAQISIAKYAVDFSVTDAEMATEELLKTARLMENLALRLRDHDSVGGKATEHAKRILPILASYRQGFIKFRLALDERHAVMSQVIEGSGVLISGWTAKIKDDLIEGQKAISAKTTAGMKQIQNYMFVFGACAVLLALLLSILNARSISGSIKGMVAAMRDLASGNFNVVLPGLGSKNEIGDMARAVEAFKLKAVEKAREEAEENDAVARAAEMERKVEMEKLADYFESTVGEIIGSVASSASQLEASAGSLSANTEKTKQLSALVASASDEAASNVRSVATATEEMSNSVSEIASQVQSSSLMAEEAVQQALQTDKHISELSISASKIGDVIKLISGVAEQTNLLALNATIEAARAGEAGRGFAVVANEVKSLATQTASATEEIRAQIAEVQNVTEKSVLAIKGISTTITRMAEIATSIASAAEQQGVATQEISSNVQRAAMSSAEISSSIADVDHGASETGAASAQVLSAARTMSQESARLKQEVSKFLGTVRAA